MKKETRPSLFWIGLALLVLPGLIHAYLLMPFPGSQDINAITVSYYLEKIIWPLRVAGVLMLIRYFIKYFGNNSTRGKYTKAIVLILCLGTFYFTDIAYKASAMF